MTNMNHAQRLAENRVGIIVDKLRCAIRQRRNGWPAAWRNSGIMSNASPSPEFSAATRKVQGGIECAVVIIPMRRHSRRTRRGFAGLCRTRRAVADPGRAVI